MVTYTYQRYSFGALFLTHPSFAYMFVLYVFAEQAFKMTKGEEVMKYVTQLREDIDELRR